MMKSIMSYRSPEANSESQNEKHDGCNEPGRHERGDDVGLLGEDDGGVLVVRGRRGDSGGRGRSGMFGHAFSWS